ncbi:tripartite tricarboxylate transporter substrate binding protein [Pigmentiphaga sp.]|uniref:Bug family tripartite tricarboxylate transporter substrate binding protein n=1 Tax=Pigmentiphaga sp. TaxID=1977564 RepID=UPI0026004530|nr:tripartite tricarboxylate transporter substrate binding protein [Pigmentiphaga sp.]MBX6317961.1 tripartite tricarboxylate transporter substrate binding protein [Pigmentiphaga sp.]
MNIGNNVRRLVAAGLLLCPAVWANVVQGQASDWPSRPVTIIVPSAAGGAADFTARAFASFITKTYPQATVVVEDRPGAGGVIGTMAAKEAKPDGYTFLLSTNSTHAANLSLYKDLRYDPVKDFVPVGRFGTFGSVLMVPKESSFDSVKDLVAYAKANPGRMSFGYYSSSSQVPAEMLKTAAGVTYEGAAYKNVTQIITDLIGKQFDFAFLDALSAAPALQNDRLKPIGVTTPRRLPQLPAVPAIAETIPGYEMQGWLGLTAPAGTPPAIVETVSALMGKAMEDHEVRKALEAKGLQAGFLPAREMKAFIAADIVRWRDWIRLAKIQPN